MAKKKTEKAAAAKSEKETTEDLGRPIDVELVKELVRYDFNQDELVELGEDLLDYVAKKTRLKEEKKSAAKTFDSEINQVELVEQEIINKMSNKFEMVSMPCVCVRNYKKGVVYYFRTDQIEADSLRIYDQDQFFALVEGGALGVDPVKTRDIKPWERQRELDFAPGEDEQVEEAEDGEGEQADKEQETVTTD